LDVARSASRLVRAWSGPGKLLALPQIYHFTDVANLPKILAAGELRCHRIARTVVDVGDASIKSRRGLINVTCGPRGKVWDYVPFYYAARSPMLYSIMCGNVPDVNPDQRRLVYLVSSTEALYEAGLACVFTDGNAATAFTRFREDPAELDHIVDWPLMRARYWFNTAEDPDRRRRRMAEFLVYQSLPLESVDGVAVYDRGAESDVAAVLRAAGSALPLAIRRAWYF
jgi:hypothetical protein